MSDPLADRRHCAVIVLAPSVATSCMPRRSAWLPYGKKTIVQVFSNRKHEATRINRKRLRALFFHGFVTEDPHPGAATP